METFPGLFLEQVKTHKLAPAIRYKRYGLWKTWTWGDADSFVREFAGGLAHRGVKPGDKIAIMGSNIPELYFAMIATQSLGAVAVPLHPDSNSEELVLALNNCEARFVVVQDQQQVDGMYAVKPQCPNFEEMAYSDSRGMQEYTSSRLHSFLQLREAGRKFIADHPDFFAESVQKVTKDTDAFILYTSGTSGEPRGVVHTHGGFIDTGTALAAQEKITRDEQLLAFLPLSYVANILFTYTLWLLRGFTVNCPENNETVMANLREIGPTVLYAPPHFYKQLYSDIIARAQRSKSKTFYKWLNVAKRHRNRVVNGNAAADGGGLKRKLGSLLVYAPLKNVYGLTRLRRAFTGGDIMSSEVFDFFRSIGVDLRKSYGTTESGGLVCVQGDEQVDSLAGEYSMGVPLPGVELKKLDNGEIAFRGINAFKEYYRNPDATAETSDSDNWVRTGDMGEIDDRGALRITERVDSMGKFSNGDVFAPLLVENALKSSPYIKEAVAVGDNKEAIAALIVVDSDTVGSWAEANRIRFTGYRDLATKDEVYELVKKTVDAVNADIEKIEGKGSPPIKRFLIMHREFNIDLGEVTRSRKIKRDVIMDKHKALVDALYSSKQTYEVKDAANDETLAELKLQSI